MNGWISVKEKLPPLAQGVLTYNGSVYIGYLNWSSQWMTKGTPIVTPVTHWQPLPGPPALKQGGNK